VLLLPALLLALGVAQDSIYSGRAGQTSVLAMRLDDSVTVDGRLDEPAWGKAARLTGFSQYLPADQRPAADSTVVLVWYSATAIHFGIRAYESHGEVRATLADRDRINGEDHVQIHLDTYHDGRRTFVFAVNALGVQGDGIRTENQGSTAPMTGFGNVDLSPDFLYDSKGRLTEWGYEVEMRIPFKSIRYGAGSRQDWGLQIVRQVQHSGFQDTWTPTRRASAGFVSQEGTLRGLHDLKRGLVLDLNPVFTNLTPGAPAADGSGRWRYDNRAEPGGNVRWGFLPNLTLNATIKPDFSQVEADAQQIAADNRYAIYYAERRPFFTDGIEFFDMPNPLVYTRNIVKPSAAARVSGKIGHTDVAVLTAIDDKTLSADGATSPLFAIVRLRRDLLKSDWLGLTLTDREEGADYNRVASADYRHVFGSVFQVNAQVALTASEHAGAPSSGTLWDLSMNRTGRRVGLRYQVNGITPQFETQTGFIPRRDFVHTSWTHRVTYLGAIGARLQNWTTRASFETYNPYRDFFAGKYPLETKLVLFNDLVFRGGWDLFIQPHVETYAFDPRAYAGYSVLHPRGGATDTVPFRVGSRVHMAGSELKLTSPQWRGFTFNVGGYAGTAPSFYETALARRVDLSAGADWRPTSHLRVSPTMTMTRSWRSADGTTIVRADIPRLKVEYQVTRAIFFRYVGQYDAERRDALRDPRSGLPIAVEQRNGSIVTATATSSNTFRNDWLFSFQPSPGTTFFAGYGTTLAEEEPFRFRAVQRTSDGFFLKLSWLFRM